MAVPRTLARESTADLFGGKKMTKIFVFWCNWEWKWQKWPEGALCVPRLKQETGVTQAHTVPTIPNVRTVLAHLCKYLDLGQQLLLLAGGAGIEKDLQLLCVQTCHTLLEMLCWWAVNSEIFKTVSKAQKEYSCAIWFNSLSWKDIMIRNVYNSEDPLGKKWKISESPADLHCCDLKLWIHFRLKWLIPPRCLHRCSSLWQKTWMPVR